MSNLDFTKGNTNTTTAESNIDKQLTKFSVVNIKSIAQYLSIFLIALLAFQNANGQCTSEIISGHAVLTPNKGCAPFYMEIKNLYSNSTPDAIYTVDWGDGTVDIYRGSDDPVDGGALDPIYTPDFSHTYTTGTTQCGHNIVIEATNGCTLPEDARLELQVSIWDTDQVGMDIDPGVFRVCQGFAASMNFTDESDWNCFPRATRQNDPPRYVEWRYEGGTMTIPGIPAGSSDPVKPVMGTGDVSRTINIPADDPTNPGNPYPEGAEYFVRLNNWNRCNPLGNPPVSTTARIVVVASPTVDFVTRKENDSNPITSAFCVDDIVYFDNESYGPAGSNLSYEWKFYDGPTASSTLLDTKNSRDPVLAYSTGGPKLVRLTVTDRNAVGGCSSVVEKTIDVFPTTIAQINASQTNFCKDEGSADSFPVTFTDVSTGSTANTEWKWEFYDENDNLYQTYPASGFSSTKLGPFTETYINPGRYKVVLITKDNLTGCYTNDVKYVNVYYNPKADYTNSFTCEGSEIEFYNQSALTSVNGNMIDKMEWDFDYNGTTFSADETYTGASMPDTISKTFAAGSRQVALRISEDQYGCYNTIIKNIDVHQRPVVDFTKDKLDGCSPLDLTVVNTGHSSQPVTVDRYIWSADYGSGYKDTLIQTVANPGFSDTVNLVFENRDSVARYFPFRLTAVSDMGCEAISDPDSVEVYPSVKPGFNDLNYDPLASNCSPVEVDFQVDAATRGLNPTAYYWTVTLKGNTQDSETTPPSNPQYNYEFNATGINVNEFKVRLGTDIPGVCTSDSIMTIKVNPIPVSDFKIDTLAFDCEKVILEVDAIQKGLVEYNWTITDGASIYPVDTLGDRFTYEVPRPAPGFPDKNVSFDLDTKNFTFCASTVTNDGMTVLAQDDINAGFNAIPTELVYPNTLVFFDNTTNSGSWVYHWDFGDSTTSVSEDPGYHDFKEIGKYKVKLDVSADFCVETDTQTIKIIAPPLFVDFDYTPQTGCAPLTVDFTNKSINAVDGTYYWDFGDGETSVVENPTYTYEEPGTYTVSLRASNAGGLTFTEVKENIIVVVEPPVVDFDIDPNSLVYPETEVSIINNSKTHSSNPGFLWNFDDGIYTISKDPEMHVYEFPGEYFVKLSITENSCTRTDSVRVKIEEPMPAMVDFNYKPGQGCAPVSVEFVNQTVGAVENSYVWDFGDGQGLSYEKNPVHTFYEPGVYTVTLRAKNIMGLESVIAKDSIIIVHQYPEADFTVDPENQVFPDATVNITNPGISSNRTYFWDFGDGNKSDEATPGSHTYYEPGSYTIIHTVEENGCSTTDSTSVFIKPIPPIVDFTYAPDSGCAPLTVQFTNESKYADPSTYLWDFGDGYGESNLENPTYTYYEPGLYTVSLKATNKSGVYVTEVKEFIITVFERPIASFYARPDEVSIPDEEIHITNRSHKANLYTWDMGDGTIYYDDEPVHAYQETGFFDISLIAENEHGCTDTLVIEQAVEAIIDNDLKVPNAFTPSLEGPSGGFIGSNGHNDVFYPVTRGVSQYNMQIFTRWGELIFETNNKNYGWDGYHNGKVCPQDVYIYKVEVKYLDGKEETLFGDVTLIR